MTLPISYQLEVLDLVKSDCEDSSKFYMKKNCVVKIAKMARPDEVSRKERGQDKAKDWKVDRDSDARMLDVGDEVPLEQMGEEMTSFSGHPF